MGIMTVDMDGDLPTIADDLVVTKYKMAAEIVNKVLKEMETRNLLKKLAKLSRKTRSSQKVSPSPRASPATTVSATTPRWPARRTPPSLTGTSSRSTWPRT